MPDGTFAGAGAGAGTYVPGRGGTYVPAGPPKIASSEGSSSLTVGAALYACMKAADAAAVSAAAAASAAELAFAASLAALCPAVIIHFGISSIGFDSKGAGGGTYGAGAV